MNSVEVIVGGTVYHMNSKTYSKTERTILNWDSDYMEEFRKEYADVVEEPTNSSDLRLRVNEFGQVVHPPIEPEEPDTSNWKKMTRKRWEKLRQYKKDKEEYDKAMDEWLKLPYLDDGRTREEHIMDLIHALRTKPRYHGVVFRDYYNFLNGTFENKVPDYVVLDYFVKKYGQVCVTSKPVTHTELVIKEPVEGESWVEDLIDAEWRKHETRINRKAWKQHRKQAQREADKSTQLTLFTCDTTNEEDIPLDDTIHSFEDNIELGKSYLTYLLRRTVPICNGSITIDAKYIIFTQEELGELKERISH